MGSGWGEVTTPLDPGLASNLIPDPRTIPARKDLQKGTPSHNVDMTCTYTIWIEYDGDPACPLRAHILPDVVRRDVVAHRCATTITPHHTTANGPVVYVRRGMGTVLSTARSLCTTRHGRAPVRGVVELEAPLVGGVVGCVARGCTRGPLDHRSGLMRHPEAPGLNS